VRSGAHFWIVGSEQRTLMGHDKDDRRGALDGLDNVRHGDDVVRQLHAGQVLFVDMLRVDNLGELLALKLGRLAGSPGIPRPARAHTSSSNTQMGVRGSNRSLCLRTLFPAIFAIADPLGYQPSDGDYACMHACTTHQLPEPMMATFSLVMVVVVVKVRARVWVKRRDGLMWVRVAVALLTVERRVYKVSGDMMTGWMER
jgi:hypothetical protein